MCLSPVVHESPKKIYHGQWKTYMENMSYSLEDEESCDVTVTAGRFSIKAHKTVLQSVFTHFNFDFTHPMKENNKNDDVVKLKEMKEEVLTSFLIFAYSNVLTIDNNNVQDIFVAADYFLLPKLKLFCEELIIEQLSGSNVFGLRHLGQNYHSNNLVNKADKFIASNFVKSTSGE